MNSNNSYKKNNKGFYITMAIALTAIIASTVLITYSSNKIKTKQTHTSQQSELSSSPIVSENANNPKNDVPDTRNDVQIGQIDTTNEPLTSKSEMQSKKTDETSENKTTVPAETTKENISCCLPVGTQILKDYSNGVPVKSKTMNDWRLHNGVDFSGEAGDDVHAVRNGKVTRIYDDSMWGKTVEIDHGNGMVAKYCGFDELSVEENSNVEKEQVIGSLGDIPIESADNTHLHLEITVNGKITDPIEAMGKENISE